MNIVENFFTTCFTSGKSLHFSRHGFKASKEAKVVERKTCFTLEAGNQWSGDQGRGGQTRVQKLTPPPTDNQRARAFIDGRSGLHAEIAVSSDSHLEIGHAVI